MNMRWVRHLGAGIAAVSLAACQAVGPDYRLPEDSAFSRVQQRPLRLDARGSQAVDPAQAAVEGRWWKLYSDPALDALVEQALKANTELRIAAARLKRSQALYARARAAGGFGAELEASGGRGRISAESLLQPEQLPPFNLADASLAVSYQLDLFGRIRRGEEAAQANTEAAQAASELARISVVASVVGAYSEICHSNHELEVARHSLAVQQRSRDVVARLAAAGRDTPVEVARADSQVAALRAAIPPMEARRQAAGYELAALLGDTPDKLPAAAMQCQEAPELRQPIPLGNGAALLRRRPDVRHAERELATATAEIGVATAELYPDIRLGASVGASGLLEDFGKPATQEWMIGPLISWTLPDRGARARVAATQAGAEEALARFDQVVLDALRETQTILSQYAEDLRRVAALRDARDKARAAAQAERRLYSAGRQPYLSSLDAERSLAATEATLADAEARVSRDQIKLFLALGGGWQDDASRTAASGE